MPAATAASPGCGRRTLFDDLVAGVVDKADDRCSKPLVVDSDGTVKASDLAIGALGITSLSDTVRNLDLSGNALPELPPFQAKHLNSLYLDRNPVTSFADLHLPSSLKVLSMRSTNVTSFKGVEWPPALSELHLINSRLTSLLGLTGANLSQLRASSNTIEDFTDMELPPSLVGLYLDRNNIRNVSGVSFPSSLVTLDLSYNPIQELEIAAKDVQLFTTMKTFLAQVNQTSCRHAKAKLQSIRTVSVCVLPDDEWKTLYATTVSATDGSSSSMVITPVPSLSQANASDETPTPNPNKMNVTDKNSSATASHDGSSSSSLSSMTIIGIAIGGVVAVVVVVAVFLAWKRRRQHTHEAEARATMNDKQPGFLDSNIAYLALKDRASDPALQPSSSLEFIMPSTSTTTPKHSSIEDLLLSNEHIVAARIPTSILEQQDRIGRGTYGVVYRGTLFGEPVAIKRLAKEVAALGNDGQLIFQSLVAEIQLMIRLVHPNLVTLLGVAWDSDSLSHLRVVFEYMERGDLRQNLVQFERHGRAKVFDKEKVRIALDIAKGLAHLHAQNPKVIHRNLKSRNILLNGKMQAKLTDFGISRRPSEYPMAMTAALGTNLWMAPEVFTGQQYNEKADMFSFGVVLSELNLHAMPYSDVVASDQDQFDDRAAEVALLQQVALGTRRVHFRGFAYESQVVMAIGNACVDIDPKQRPTALEVVDQLESVLSEWEE